MEARLDLDPLPSSAPAARRFTRETLTGWGADAVAETVLLLTSELVTNALLHARTPMTLTLSHRADVLRIEVLDGSPVIPAQRHYSAESTTGRGLRFLQEFGREWGVEPTAKGTPGKRVWVELQPA